MSEQADLETVVGLLDDEYARTILVATSVEAMTAKELAERCDASRPTVYRRVERLVDADLVVEQTRPRPDGHHDTVYAADMRRVEVTLRDGEIDIEVERRGVELGVTIGEEDVADRLTKMWENL